MCRYIRKSFFNLIVFSSLLVVLIALNWVYVHGAIEWVGILVILCTLRTRMATLVFIRIFYLITGEPTYSRIEEPDANWSYHTYVREDKVKIKIFKMIPDLMLQTDYKHGALAHGLPPYLYINEWVRRVYPITLIQLAVGYCIYKGYYSNYYYEMFIGWGVICVVGSLIAFIPQSTNLGKILHAKLFIFKCNIFDIFYYLSFSFTRRNGVYVFRLILSFIILGLTILTYYGIPDLLIREFKERSVELWQWLLAVIPT